MVRSVRMIVAAIETVSRVLGAIGSLYLDFTAFQGLQEFDYKWIITVLWCDGQ